MGEIFEGSTYRIVVVSQLFCEVDHENCWNIEWKLIDLNISAGLEGPAQ
jgi:hypothetical protein